MRSARFLLLSGSVALVLSSTLLALATSASDACAWVLWTEERYQLLVADKATGNLPAEAHTWTVIQADPSKAGCQAALEEKVKQSWTGTKRDKVTISRNMVFITRYPVEGYGDEPSAHEIHRFVCLPDTIDPRGK